MNLISPPKFSSETKFQVFGLPVRKKIDLHLQISDLEFSDLSWSLINNIYPSLSELHSSLNKIETLLPSFRGCVESSNAESLLLLKGIFEDEPSQIDFRTKFNSTNNKIYTSKLIGIASETLKPILAIQPGLFSLSPLQNPELFRFEELSYGIEKMLFLPGFPAFGFMPVVDFRLQLTLTQNSITLFLGYREQSRTREMYPLIEFLSGKLSLDFKHFLFQ
jgi:hypothetical protein